MAQKLLVRFLAGEHGIVVSEDHVAGLDDALVRISAGGELVIGIDAGGGVIFGRKKMALFFEPVAREDGHAEELVLAVPVADGQHAFPRGVAQALGDDPVPPQGRIPVIGSLHNDVSPGLLGGAVPGGDAAALAFDGCPSLKDISLGVVIVAAKDPLHAGRIGSFFHPEDAGVDGLLRAATGGVADGDADGLQLSPLAFNLVGLGVVAHGAGGRDVEINAFKIAIPQSQITIH